MTNNFEMRDGRVVIHRIEKPGDHTSDNKVTAATNNDGLVKLTPTDSYVQSKIFAKYGDRFVLASQQQQQPIPTADPETPQKKKAKKNKHNKRNKKKQQKYKDKKGAKKTYKHICNNLDERNERNGNLLAELLKKTDFLLIIDHCLWIYNQKTGCFDSSSVDNVASKLRMLLDEKDRLKVSSQEYKEAYNQLMISEELVTTKNFFANQPFVNCINGVFDVKNKKLLPHSSSYKFKHYIKANYNPEAKCKNFLKFVSLITNEDRELTELFQVMMGYIISHYTNAKTAFLLFGVSDTGKSVICKILPEIIGEDYVSHSDLADLHKQEFAASISGMILNVAPDLKNGALKDVGFFKALTSHNDTISARLLYSNPGKVRGETKMIFSANHLLSFDSNLDIGDIEAVFNRFLYFPFQNEPIPKDKDRKNFSSELLEERDGIFTWAMDGLRKYIENGENFPYSKISQKIKLKNMAQFCPEKSFFEKCLVSDDDAFESTQVVKEAYDVYCKSNNVSARGNIRAYIMNHKKIFTKKKRIDDNGILLPSGIPRAAFVGIRLKDKYRVSKS